MHLLFYFGEDVGWSPMEVSHLIPADLCVFAAEDSMGLSCARLPICQKCGIVTLKNWFH